MPANYHHISEIIGYLYSERSNIELKFDGKYSARLSEVYTELIRLFNGFQEANYNGTEQKWLKDRKGRTLNVDDLMHYQRMIVALVETAKLMEEIDVVVENSGGFPLK